MDGQMGGLMNGTDIPLNTIKPVRSLDDIFGNSQKDAASIPLICPELDGCLKTVDISGLSGNVKP